MNRDETVELFLKGREAWNAWAEDLLAERKAMEAAGIWKSRRRLELPWWRDEGRNLETEAWLDRAFADFSRCLFLVQGQKDTEEKTEEEENGGVPAAPCQSIQLEANRIDFSLFVFPSDVSFKSTTFTGEAYFFGATFTGAVRFECTTFSHHALFERTTFSLDASFESATFTGIARFERATLNDITFERSAFTCDASFKSATFMGTANFDGAAFNGIARFDRGTFIGTTTFISATFTGDAWFNEAAFTGHASFARANFEDHALFRRTKFAQTAEFGVASFKQYASFASSRFEAYTSFGAIRGQRGFDMEGAIFETVPNFIQAHFEEAPRLDNLKVFGRWVKRHPWPVRKAPRELPEKEKQEEQPESKWRQHWYTVRHFGGRVWTWPARAVKGAWRRLREGNSSIPARWRALKRLAILGHDTERELEFHAREMKSQRFEDDWPLPIRFWRPAGWAGFLRFWCGIFYEVFSDFGRSTGRPFLLWWATVAVFAMYFLSGQPDVLERRRAEPQTLTAPVTAYVKLVPSLLRDPPACYSGTAGEDGRPDQQHLIGLAGSAAASTNALAEAFRLAIRNGSIFLDGGDDSARRTYGCLYGIQSFGGSPAPFVPGFVSRHVNSLTDRAAA